MTGLSNEEMAIRETQFDIELTETIKRIFPELAGEEIDSALIAQLTGAICGTLGAIIGGSIGVLAYSAPSRDAKIAGLSQLRKKPTPGPWRYERTNGSQTTGTHMIAGAVPGYLAEVRDCGSGDVEANAMLIAAAPELLSALEKIAGDIHPQAAGPWKDVRDVAVLAIARASTP